MIYFPYSIFVAPQFASPVVQTFPNQQQQQQQQGNDEPLDKRDLLKGLYNQDAVVIFIYLFLFCKYEYSF